MKRLLVLLTVLLLPMPLAAADWYVRSSCGNDGDGTAEACAGAPAGVGPWNLFANISWGSINPGDTLFLVSGETYTEQMNIGASGTSGSPILITVSGVGTATIDAEDTRSRGFSVGGQDWITIDGVRGNAVEDDFDYGIKIINLAAGGGGVHINTAPAGTNIKVFRLDISGTQTTSTSDGQGGILFQGSGANFYEIAFCWIHGLTADPASSRWAVTGMTIFNAESGVGYDNVLIHHNVVENIAHDGIKTSNNASIYNNVLHKVWKAGTHADALLIQNGNHAKIYNNYVDGTAGQIIYFDQTGAGTKGDYWIYNNVLFNPDCSTNLNLDPEVGNIDGVNIFNNVFWESAATVLRGNGRGSNSVTNLRIVNNIFKQGAGSARPVSLSTDNTFVDDDSFDHNIYVGYGAGDDIVDWIDGTQKTLSELQALSPVREANGQLGTPDFVDSANGDFHLTASDTLAKDQGDDLSAFFTADLDGITRPQGSAWDVGAYEFVSGKPTLKRGTGVTVK